jgi:long-chain acyl-CoA synthetase
MLYESWCRVARSCSHELALHDIVAGRRWTFAELAAAAEAGGLDPAPVVIPQGPPADFVITLLRAWRLNRTVCALEPGQSLPEIRLPLPRGIVHLKITSGMTGAPRLVAFTASQLWADLENIVSTMGLRPEWPNLGVISMAHSYGFSNLILALLLHGVPLIVVGSALPEPVRLAAATQTDVTLAAVPVLWRTWHEANVIPPNVRLAISAGAALHSELEREVFARHGLKIHNFYGSSECGGIAYDASNTPRQDTACAGAPMRNVELSTSPNGCLEVRSRAVAQAYWPETTADLADGVFRSYDLVEISNGLVYLRGRASDQINVAGRKVSPETIEEALVSHPAVRECVVFGVPSTDENRGESIVACLAAQGVSGEVLKAFLIAKLPAWQVPRAWWFVDTLHPDARGKLSRAECRQRYLERPS